MQEWSRDWSALAEQRMAFSLVACTTQHKPLLFRAREEVDHNRILFPWTAGTAHTQKCRHIVSNLKPEFGGDCEAGVLTDANIKPSKVHFWHCVRETLSFVPLLIIPDLTRRRRRREVSMGLTLAYEDVCVYVCVWRWRMWWWCIIMDGNRTNERRRKEEIKRTAQSYILFLLFDFIK